MGVFEEMFDVVDDHDQVVDCLSRSEVHARNLLHRSVHGIVFDDNQRIFLQHRGPDRDCDPNLWDSSVGGHLQAGEMYDEAIIRETQEELGLVLESTPERLFKLEACEETAFEFCWVYRIRNNGPFVIDPTEATEGRWFTLQQLHDWVAESPEQLTGSFAQIWQQLNLRDR